MSRTLRVGARGSRLSLWQVQHAIDRLARIGVSTELRVMSSSGDRDADSAIEDLASDAPFVDDIEDALRAGAIDVAVHSLKDMALRPPSDLVVAALLPRGPVTESLVARDGRTLHELPPGAVVGTSSPRRRAQVRLHRPDLVCRTMRGPVDERVEQVRSGRFDAAVLATAGLERLGQHEAITQTFALRDFVPAPGQGALAVQLRADDRHGRSMVARLDDFTTRLAAHTELAAQQRLGAAGQLMAASATVEHAFITLRLRILSREGRDHLDVVGSGIDPDRVAGDAVERALEQWAVAR